MRIINKMKHDICITDIERMQCIMIIEMQDDILWHNHKFPYEVEVVEVDSSFENRTQDQGIEDMFIHINIVYIYTQSHVPTHAEWRWWR